MVFSPDKVVVHKVCFEGTQYSLKLTRDPGRIDKTYFQVICHLIIEFDCDPESATVTPLFNNYPDKPLKGCGVKGVVRQPHQDGFICQIWPCHKSADALAFEVVLNKCHQNGHPNFTVSKKMLREALQVVNMRPSVNNKESKMPKPAASQPVSLMEMKIIAIFIKLGGEVTPDTWDRMFEETSASGFTHAQVQNTIQRLKDKKGYIKKPGSRAYQLNDLDTQLVLEDGKTVNVKVNKGVLVEPDGATLDQLFGLQREDNNPPDPTPPTPDLPAQAPPIDINSLDTAGLIKEMMNSLEEMLAPYKAYLKDVHEAETALVAINRQRDQLREEINSLSSRLEETQRTCDEAAERVIQLNRTPDNLLAAEEIYKRLEGLIA